MQQIIDTLSEPVAAHLHLPGAKSITERALILAALADGVSELTDIAINDITHLMIDALRQVGIIVQLDEKSNSCIIAGGNGKFPKKQATLWCGDSRMVARYLMTACANSNGVYHLDGTDKLHESTITALLHILFRQGAQSIPSDSTHIPITLVGADAIKGGELELEEINHSQLLSALLLITPFARNAVTMLAPNLSKSSYIDMTCTMMAEFGVLVQHVLHGQFMIPVPQRYQARDYIIEPDLKMAIYFFAAAAITGGEVSIQTCRRKLSKQVEVKFFTLAEKMGCMVIESSNSLSLHGPKKLIGADIALTHFSDIAYAFIVMAIFASTPSSIHFNAPLPSQQLAALQQFLSELTKLNVAIAFAENKISITPCTLHGGVIDSTHKASIGMAASIIGLKIPGIIINNTSSIAHDFPDFYVYFMQMAQGVKTS